MKRFLALLLAGSTATAAPPPVSIQALNGSYRPVTPVAIVDANGDQVTSFAGGGSGGSGGAITAAAGSIIDMGTGASPGANTLNGRLAALLSAQQATTSALGTPLQAGGSIANTGFAINGTLPAFAATPTVNLGTLNGAATSAKQDSLIAALGSPFQAGGLIGNTGFNENLTQVGGTAVATGAGTSNAGTLRVILSSDSPTGGGGGSSGVAQGSATSGQTGTLVQGAVTTAAPAYTTAQTSPLSLTTAGGLRVDGSATTQPVSGTVTLGAGAAVIGSANLAVGGTSLTTASSTVANVGNVVGLNVISLNRVYTGSNYQPANDIGGASGTLSSGAGTTAVGIIPTASASVGIGPATVANATSQVAKAGAGNLYSLNVDNAAVTGTYVIVYNATAAPTAGATLTASLELWHAIIPSSGTIDKVFPVPVYGSTGLVVLYSTSLTTFTAPATAPLLSSVQVR